ncbi:hypothetical protein [uncultured Nostoc sp.]|uniref:hypothetical protein n=1 Tax=uncultured Nostoc sp. TaxID=340711 RepID=UPI00261BE571|nr:hypothetical protein [uncultured Nostoc sp.]
MAKEAKSQVYYINLGGTVGNVGAMRFAWRGKKDAYPKDVAKELGVVIAKDTDAGLMFGANSPRPAEVRIGYTDGNGNSKSTVRFCEPDKLGAVTTGGKLNSKKIIIAGTKYNINSCTLKSN